MQERAAFQRLENAMVDGSIPATMRADQSIQGKQLAPIQGVVHEEGAALEQNPESPSN